jgi:ribosomal-protein-alanine N-acetyltransferase
MVPVEQDPAFRIRPFRLADLPELVRLDRCCFPHSIAYDRFEMLHQLTSPGHFSLLAVPGDGGNPSLLGFIIAAAASPGRSGQIVTLDVHPDFRRQGIGRQLMAAAEQRLAGSGHPAVRLQVAVDNTGARKFYRGLGYHPAGRCPDYYPDGTDAVEMVKRIDDQRTGKKA